jgi:5'-nucleotidase
MGDDVTYSGTVAGAFEGMLLGLPSMAVSSTAPDPRHIHDSARAMAQIARFVLENGLPRDTVLNVNIPDLPFNELKGVRTTRMGRRTYEDEIIRREDPRGVSYYWIGGDSPGHVHDTGTDFAAIDDKCISVTPLHRDLTNYEALAVLEKFDVSSVVLATPAATA